MRESMTMFPGPVSKATTWPSVQAAGRYVTFAMPPIFWMHRDFLGWRKRRKSAKGTSGAPWPPAARSRGRKSATVVMPVRSAMTQGSAS